MPWPAINPRGRRGSNLSGKNVESGDTPLNWRAEVNLWSRNLRRAILSQDWAP
jgi:hypothetical protein